MSLAEKTKVADFVIDNDGTLEDLLRKTDDVLAQICAQVGVDAARYAPADRSNDRIGPG